MWCFGTVEGISIDPGLLFQVRGSGLERYPRHPGESRGPEGLPAQPLALDAALDSEFWLAQEWRERGAGMRGGMRHREGALEWGVKRIRERVYPGLACPYGNFEALQGLTARRNLAQIGALAIVNPGGRLYTG